MRCTKFNLAAVNRKVGRKIGFNKQSIKKKKRNPQQEIIIWAIVHSVKGLARRINTYQDEMLWPGFLPAPCLISLVTKVALRAEEVCNCVVFQGKQRICHWKRSLAPAYFGETSHGQPERNRYERKPLMPTEVVCKNNSLTIPSALD